MIRRFLILSIFLLVFLCVNANVVNALCVYTSSNDKVYFLFSDFPKVEFEANTIVVQTNSKKEVIQFENFQKIAFEVINDETGVNNISVDLPIFYIENNTINVYNNFYGDIYVYNIEGQFIGKYFSEEKGFCKIIIERKGTYIIKNKKFNFKVILR